MISSYYVALEDWYAAKAAAAEADRYLAFAHWSLEHCQESADIAHARLSAATEVLRDEQEREED